MFALCDLTTISQQQPHTTTFKALFPKYAGDKWLNNGTIMQEKNSHTAQNTPADLV